MKKVFVTGGSGFIGTNVVSSLLADGYVVLSIDIKPPQDKTHVALYEHGDILDGDYLIRTVQKFAPDIIVHLAARTDLNEKVGINGYQANTIGVQNIISAIKQQPSVQRCIFSSTKLVCSTNYTPKTEDDYCPDTLYGRSKVQGERIVKSAEGLTCTWCIVRPTSIWGPWSMAPHIPYGRFFQLISKGLYYHLGNVDSPKSFGFVGNTVFQLKKLLLAECFAIDRKVFYLSDYETYYIREWANTISIKLKRKPIHDLPEPLIYLAAKLGDFAKIIGYREPPISTFRLKNMRADTSGIPLENIKKVTGTLPYTIEQGVDCTITWMRRNGYISC